MRVYNLYNLKEGTTTQIVMEDHEEQEQEEVRNDKMLPLSFAVCKLFVPMVAAIVAFVLLSKHLYGIRGEFAMGSEFIIPPFVWYLVYKMFELFE